MPIFYNYVLINIIKLYKEIIEILNCDKLIYICKFVENIVLNVIIDKK